MNWSLIVHFLLGHHAKHIFWVRSAIWITLQNPSYNHVSIPGLNKNVADTHLAAAVIPDISLFHCL